MDTFKYGNPFLLWQAILNKLDDGEACDAHQSLLQVQNFRYKYGSDPSTLMEYWETIMRNLESANMSMTPEMQVLYWKIALPSEMNAFKQGLETQRTLTLTNLYTQLSSFYASNFRGGKRKTISGEQAHTPKREARNGRKQNSALIVIAKLISKRTVGRKIQQNENIRKIKQQEELAEDPDQWHLLQPPPLLTLRQRLPLEDRLRNMAGVLLTWQIIVHKLNKSQKENNVILVYTKVLHHLLHYWILRPLVMWSTIWDLCMMSNQPSNRQ